MKDVPVKIKHKNTWIVTKMGIGPTGFVIPAPINSEVPFASIIDLGEKYRTLIVTSKQEIETTLKIKSVDKVLNILKRLILKSCHAFRIVAYFKLMAVRSGVQIKDTAWEKGTIVVVSTGIWFVTQNRQVCVPLSDVTAIEFGKTSVKGTLTDMIQISHSKSGHAITSQVLCPLPALQEFYVFLKGATKGIEIHESELDASDRQVAMLIHSGADSRGIENMLNIPKKQLDVIYDKILNLGIAEVVATRRELQLTTKGISFITDITKSRKK
jgi:helix-turn-helix protein